MTTTKTRRTARRTPEERRAQAEALHEQLTAQVATLARAGADALAAIEAGRPLDAARVAEARTLLDTLAKQEAASWRPFDPFFAAQPPADLIVKIGPGIRTLIDAAAAGRR